MIRDVVVVLPGIMGSVLSRAGQDVWALSLGAAFSFLKAKGASINALELADPAADDGVEATGLISDAVIVPGLVKIDGYTALMKFLRENPRLGLTEGKNLFTFPYDWRRDNRIHARRLKATAEQWLGQWRAASGNADARLILVGHSMGGLVSRYYLEVLEGWRETRSLITFGTPFRGSLMALDRLVNGMSKKIGPFAALELSRTLRSFPSLHQLLPIFPCCELGGGEMLRVSELPDLANLDARKVADALEFHREIERAVTSHLRDEAYLRSRYQLHPVVGTHQPTVQSARVLADGHVTPIFSFRHQDLGGDGTVPRVSATPLELSDEHREVYVADKHASLQNNDSVWTQVEGLLLGNELDLKAFRSGRARLSLDVEDVFEPGAPVFVRGRSDLPGVSLVARIENARTGAAVATLSLQEGADGWSSAELGPLPGGSYRVVLDSDPAAQAAAVRDLFIVAGGEAKGRRLRSAETDDLTIQWFADIDVAKERPAMPRAGLTLVEKIIAGKRQFATHAADAWHETALVIPPKVEVLPASPDLPTTLPRAFGAKWTEKHVIAVDPGGKPWAVGIAKVTPQPRSVVITRPPGTVVGAGRPFKWNAGDGEEVLDFAEPREVFSAEEITPTEHLLRGGGEETTPTKHLLQRGIVGTPKKQPEVIRHPELQLDGELAPGSSVAVDVDLLREKTGETVAEGIRLAAGPGFKQKDVEVQLWSPELTFDQPTGVITVHEDGRSTSFTTVAKVSEKARGSASVFASFTIDGRNVGTASRVFREGYEPPTRGSVGVSGSGSGADLTVQIFRVSGGSPGQLFWCLQPKNPQAIPGLPASLDGTCDIGGAPQDFVRSLFRACAGRDNGRHKRILEGIGEQLWDLTPECFRKTYEAMRQSLKRPFSIQFITGEAYIPWELMRPPLGDDFGLLAQEHPVARWATEYAGYRKTELPGGPIYAFAPSYEARRAEGIAPLKHAREEVQRLKAEHNAVVMSATAEEFFDTVEQPPAPIGVLHYAGHARFDERNPALAQMLLEDQNVSSIEVSRNQTVLGERHSTLVVMNACEAGASGTALNVVGGWAQAFMKRKFGGLVAPLWPVFDDDASEVINELYLRIRNGVPVAEALRLIRKEHGHRSATFLSYVFYGDVSAVMSG